MRVLSLLVSAVSFYFLSAPSSLYAEEKHQPEKVQKDNAPRLVTLRATPIFQSGQYIARLDAGRLTAGSEYHIRVEIESPSNDLMVFRKIIPSCVCFDAKLSPMSLSPKATLTLDFKARVPKKVERANGAWSLLLEPNNESGLGGILVSVKFDVAGVLSFMDKRIVLEASPGEADATFQLPMMLTEPVESNNVMIYLPDSFKSIKSKVLTNDGKSQLQLTVPRELLETIYVSGEISCMDSTTGMEDKIYCVIKGEPPVAIYPNTLRGIVADDGSATIAAMIQIKPSQRDYVQGNKPSSLIDATMADKPIPVELTVVSEHCVRASLKIPAAVVDSIKKVDRPEIHWLIRTKEETHERRSFVSFSN